MKARRHLCLFLTALAVIACFCRGFAQPGNGEDSGDACTIGVAAGRATSDGRPLVWKTRDTEFEDNKVSFFPDAAIRYVAVVNAGGTSPWMAVNERGFALVNANSLDLPGGGNSGNGRFMRAAIGTCATVADFERLLDSTNVTGRLTQAHFAVIDSTGAAALFETGGDRYWKFDAADPVQTPEGYVIRTNFAANGGGTVGLERFVRSCSIVGSLRASDNLNHRGLINHHMRDFSDWRGIPYEIPFHGRVSPALPWGFFGTSYSICRLASVSAAIIHGVTGGEPSALSTMWVMLGQPAASIAVPYWPVGETPFPAAADSTAPLCDESKRIKSLLFFRDPFSGRALDYVDSFRLRDGNGGGIWTVLLPAEEHGLNQAERSLRDWRVAMPRPWQMLSIEEDLAAAALSVLRNLLVPRRDTLVVLPGRFALGQNYPNPFNSVTRIRFSVPPRRAGGQALPGVVSITMYDILGRELETLANEVMEPGTHTLTWNAAGYPSGVYFCRLVTEGITETKELILIR